MPDGYTPDRPHALVLTLHGAHGSAQSLGLANGDLFSEIIAFSPGFADPPTRRGKPRIFVTHGTEDEVLPIGRTSKPLVAELREQGYEVEFRTFDGGHTVPPRLARAAVDWLTSPGG